MRGWLAGKYPPKDFRKSAFSQLGYNKKVLISDFRGGTGENFAPMCSLREKRYFSQKFAYVFEKYAKLSFRIPDPPPNVIPLTLFHMRIWS